MGEELKKVECESPCSFMVRSHDEKEIVEMVMQHAEKVHNMKIAVKDIRNMIRPA
ncbi:MAG: DUF1059 domain-containing protein [Dissulfurispiraceae bacterium]